MFSNNCYCLLFDSENSSSFTCSLTWAYNCQIFATIVGCIHYRLDAIADLTYYVAHGGALSDDAHLTSVERLSHALGLSRDQSGIERVKLAQR